MYIGWSNVHCGFASITKMRGVWDGNFHSHPHLHLSILHLNLPNLLNLLNFPNLPNLFVHFRGRAFRRNTKNQKPSSTHPTLLHGHNQPHPHLHVLHDLHG